MRQILPKDEEPDRLLFVFFCHILSHHHPYIDFGLHGFCLPNQDCHLESRGSEGVSGRNCRLVRRLTVKLELENYSCIINVGERFRRTAGLARPLTRERAS
jgi:hypothetical protein